MEENKIIDDFNEEDKMEGGTYHDFKKNDTVFGILDKFVDTPNGEGLAINTNDGEVIIGSLTALKGRFTEKDIGKKVKIVYKGEEKSKAGRVFMAFDTYKK